MKIGDVEFYISKYWQDKKEIKKISHDCDCENCVMGWEIRSYEGECEDCGCCFDYDFNVPLWKCLLPTWIKKRIKKAKRWDL
ncbi:MAG: hypothetical protein J6S85_10200 [Methanobrevibacter sp.]|nr:hypothetical protein [Methanobrevibacter sp.]